MSLFEWLADPFNPGPVGYVDVKRRSLFPGPLKRFWALFFMLIGLVLLYFMANFISSFPNSWALWIGFIVYVVLSYFLTPTPDNSNLGWAGGLINNPFRLSDNINRFLVFFYLFLLPGKLIVFALQIFHRLLKYNL